MEQNLYKKREKGQRERKDVKRRKGRIKKKDKKNNPRKMNISIGEDFIKKKRDGAFKTNE